MDKPMFGDVVLWRGTLRYIVLGAYVTPSLKQDSLHVIDEELMLFSDATSVYLSDVTIVEYSPMHKLQIMSKAFDYVSLVREMPYKWSCAIQDNFVDLWDAKGNTPDEAINAVWQAWKGSA
jgi:hypothetical protein